MPSMTPPSHAFLKTSSTMMIPDGCNTKVSLASSGSFRVQCAQWHVCMCATHLYEMEKKATGRCLVKLHRSPAVVSRDDPLCISTMLCRLGGSFRFTLSVKMRRLPDPAPSRFFLLGKDI